MTAGLSRPLRVGCEGKVARTYALPRTGLGVAFSVSDLLRQTRTDRTHCKKLKGVLSGDRQISYPSGVILRFIKL